MTSDSSRVAVSRDHGEMGNGQWVQALFYKVRGCGEAESDDGCMLQVNLTPLDCTLQTGKMFSLYAHSRIQ